MRRTIPLLACLLLLAACGKASAPPDPATNAAAREGARHHELEDAIKARDYRDKAKHAGDATLGADKQHDDQLEKETGG